MFLDGHVESHTLQELGYVVTPYTYTYTNPTTGKQTSINTNVAWPQYLANTSLSMALTTASPVAFTPGTLTPANLPFGQAAGNSGGIGINNVSDNHLWTGTGRDEALSQYYNVQ